MVTSGQTPVRTFLIADVRGYSRFTEEYGDEAAARLAAKFADLVNEGVQMRDGKVVEIRGDEALARLRVGPPGDSRCERSPGDVQRRGRR